MLVVLKFEANIKEMGLFKKKKKEKENMFVDHEKMFCVLSIIILFTAKA